MPRAWPAEKRLGMRSPEGGKQATVRNVVLRLRNGSRQEAPRIPPISDVPQSPTLGLHRRSENMTFMELRPMTDLAGQLKGGTGHWLKILQDELLHIRAYADACAANQPAPPLPDYARPHRHVIKSLAPILGIPPSELVPFLGAPDREHDILHVHSKRFDCWVNADEPPLLMLLLQPGPMRLFRGLPVDSKLEWKDGNLEGWSSLSDLLSQLKFTPVTTKDLWNGWDTLVWYVMTRLQKNPDSWPDFEVMLSAQIHLKGAPRRPDILHELALLATSEEQLLMRLPQELHARASET